VFAPARPQLSRGIFFTGDGNQQLSPGTAQTLPIGELGGAFSGLGLGLCGLATAALMPLIALAATWPFFDDDCFGQDAAASCEYRPDGIF
jgi:hypothetical protein